MLELPTQPWTLASLSAGSHRDVLAKFWLAAPEDLLPSLWSSPVGEATKQLVRQLDPQYVFHPDQIALRNAIGQRFQAGFQAPMAIQLLIVNFLYSPPGLLRIQNPQANLPNWLLSDYQSLYEAVAFDALTGGSASRCCLFSAQSSKSLLLIFPSLISVFSLHSYKN